MKRLHILTQKSTYINTMIMSVILIYTKDYLELIIAVAASPNLQFMTLMLQFMTSDSFMSYA